MAEQGQEAEQQHTASASAENALPAGSAPADSSTDPAAQKQHENGIEKQVLAPEAVIADVLTRSSAANHNAGDAANSAAADELQQPPSQPEDQLADLETELMQVSLDEGSNSSHAADAAVSGEPPAEDRAAARDGLDAALAPGVSLEQADSLGSPLPPSTARIESDAFFQDEDDSRFSLNDEEEPVAPQHSAAAQPPSAPTAVSIQEAVERVAQDRQDEEMQSRLRATLGSSSSDPDRSVSPPVHNRPMSPPPGSAPRSPLPPPGVEPPEFKGLLFYDGVDSVGRPIVVVNARADAMTNPKLRNRAMDYMKQRLEPIVYQGPYCLVMVASGHQGDTSSKLPAMWLIRAYRSLSRPYKKNVKYIFLVRPSAALSAMMVVLRPFLSLKAARKLHKVDSLLDLEAASGGDLKAEQLGARFLREELGVGSGRFSSASMEGHVANGTESRQRADSLDGEVQLGSYS